jgi:hypothetical protein
MIKNTYLWVLLPFCKLSGIHLLCCIEVFNLMQSHLSVGPISWWIVVLFRKVFPKLISSMVLFKLSSSSFSVSGFRSLMHFELIFLWIGYKFSLIHVNILFSWQHFLKSLSFLQYNFWHPSKESNFSNWVALFLYLLFDFTGSCVCLGDNTMLFLLLWICRII